MDRFSWGAIIIAVIVEGFLVYAGYNNINEEPDRIVIASILPVALVVTVVLVYWLQRGET